MAGATTRLALPYPTPDDNVDVPRDIKALTDKLDPNTPVDSQGTSAARPAAGTAGRYYFATDAGVLYRDTGTAWVAVGPFGTPLVTSLPGAPADGQEVYYQADAASGVVWHLRYRAASASAYKWERVGGSPLYSEVTTGDAFTNSAYAAAPTPGPSVTVPLAGDYRVRIGATLGNNTVGVFVAMSYDIGATTAVDADMAQFITGVANQVSAISRLRTKTGLAANTALVAKYRTGGATASTQMRWMEVLPARVG